MLNKIKTIFRKDATDEEKQWQEKCAQIWSDAKVLIGLPNNGIIEDLTGESPFKSFLHLAMFMSSQKESSNWGIQPIARMITHEARNALAKQAIDEGYTHLAMIDSDHTFDKDVIHRLLLYQKDVVGVRAYKRTSPHYPCIFVNNPNAIDKESMIFADVANKGLMVTDAVGFGIILIKIEVNFSGRQIRDKLSDFTGRDSSTPLFNNFGSNPIINADFEIGSREFKAALVSRK